MIVTLSQQPQGLLFVSSEGTLGLITEATLKLAHVPEHISAAGACFEHVDDAIQAVVAVRGSGVEPAALEFLDEFTVGYISESNGLGKIAKPTIFMEFHASYVSALESVLNTLQEICREAGALSIQTTTNNAVLLLTTFSILQVLTCVGIRSTLVQSGIYQSVQPDPFYFP